MLRDSVLLDLRQGMETRGHGAMMPMGIQRGILLPREHLELTRDPTLCNNILYWLLDEPRQR
ncbi:hypothetical protein [Falsiroseomonas sp.]|uniref:hypothetical protein n=1 Tax=Falsiroseomonas sp. TaxID=2870721 RepID=UPI00356B0AFF